MLSFGSRTSPKCPCVGGLVSSVALLRGGRTFSRQALVRGLWVCGPGLTGNCESLVFSFFAVSHAGYEINDLLCYTLTTMIGSLIPQHRPKGKRSIHHGLKPQNYKPKQTFSPF